MEHPEECRHCILNYFGGVYWAQAVTFLRTKTMLCHSLVLLKYFQFMDKSHQRTTDLENV